MTLSKERNREYQKTYYQKNKEKYLERSNARKAEVRQKTIELKHQQPCVDCGVAYPHWIMQFDHLPGVDKKFNVADTGSIGSLQALMDEVAKCELVCANCHANRTWERLQN